MRSPCQEGDSDSAVMIWMARNCKPLIVYHFLRNLISDILTVKLRHGGPLPWNHL